MKYFGYPHVVLMITLTGGSLARAQGIAAPAKPAWYGHVQVFQTSFGYSINNRELTPTQLAAFTGQTWAPEMPVSGPLSQTWQSEMDIWHFRNAPWATFMSPEVLYESTPLPDMDSSRQTDLAGHLLSKPASGPGAVPAPRYALASTPWQQVIRNQVFKAIDLGADGFHFDDAQVPAIMMEPWNQPARTFDPYTMAGFRDFLRAKYSSTELGTTFDIPDIVSFQYADWIRSHGKESTWNAFPISGLAREFEYYLMVMTRSFYVGLINDAHDYAKQRYHREFTISMNLNFDASGFFALDLPDYVVSEHYPFSATSPYPHPDIKAVRAVKSSPIFVLPEPIKDGLPAQTVNMMRLITADIYAAGGMLAHSNDLSEGLQKNIRIDWSTFDHLSKFIRNHAQLYERLTTVADVALLKSPASQMAGKYPVQGPTAGEDEFEGIARLLADNNIQYECVYAPDSRFTSAPSFTVDQLHKYPLVIAPFASALDDQQVAALLAYVASGGTLLSVGPLGVMNLDGTRASRPGLAVLQQKDGESAYGSGKFIYVSAKIGTPYTATPVSGSDAAGRFRDLMGKYVSPKLTTSAVSELYHPGGATAFLYQDARSNYLVHIVNHDYNEFTDIFSPKLDVTVTLAAGSSGGWECVYVSPDFAGTQILPVDDNGGSLSVTLPNLDAYGILIFQHNTSAPEIVSAAPFGSISAIAGSSTTFSATASDLDGNPLFIQWLVDGAAVPDACGPEFVYQAPDSGGTHRISVQVSDGAHTVTREWQVQVAARQLAAVLFDETHAEGNSIDCARAAQLNPPHPDYICFSHLAGLLRSDYTVDRVTSGSLTLPYLQKYGVLVLSAPNSPFSAAEISDIAQYVSQGGGLIFLGDAGLRATINSLLQPFGVTFDRANIFQINASGDPGDVPVASFANHASMQGATAFRMNWGGSLVIAGDATAVGVTDPRPWRELDSNQTQEAGEPSGPFTLITAGNYGKGRVICFSDNAFQDNVVTYSPPNFDVFRSALRWVSGQQTGPMVNRNGIVDSASLQAAPAPGSLATLLGAGLSTTSLQAVDSPLPNSLGGVRVTVNGIGVPLLYVSPGQINFQVPWDVLGPRASVSAVVNGVTTASVPVTLSSVAPTIFTADSTQALAVIVGTTSLAAPASSVAGARPVKRGEYLSIYCTNLGPVSNQPPTGSPASPTVLSMTSEQPTVTIAGVSASVVFSGLAPGSVGMYQVNVEVPAGASSGSKIPVTLSAAGRASNTATIAVE